MLQTKADKDKEKEDDKDEKDEKEEAEEEAEGSGARPPHAPDKGRQKADESKTRLPHVLADDKEEDDKDEKDVKDKDRQKTDESKSRLPHVLAEDNEADDKDEKDEKEDDTEASSPVMGEESAETGLQGYTLARTQWWCAQHHSPPTPRGSMFVNSSLIDVLDPQKREDNVEESVVRFPLTA